MTANAHRSGEPVTGPVGRVSPRWGSAGQPLVNHALKSGDSRAVSRASVHFGRRRVASPGGVRTKAVTFEEPGFTGSTDGLIAGGGAQLAVDRLHQ